MKVNGNLKGIKDTCIEILESIYGIDIPSGELISADVLDIMVKMTEELKKEISVFINRRGKVVDVSVGDSTTVHLPIFDYRRGSRRLSGIRCIHTHPESSGHLSQVDISALVNLRLDCMAAVGVREGRVDSIFLGFIVVEQGNQEYRYTIEGPYNTSNVFNLNVLDIVREIEKNIDLGLPEATLDNQKEKVLLVGLSLPADEGSSEDLLHELEELAVTSGAEVVGKILQKKNKVDTAYYIGSGKAQELSLITQAYDVDTVIFDDELSGAQVRNLEDTIGTKVIDRTTLILDIFAQRALTREGKLQVELAQLKYRMPRLIGLGKILSRTGGGIGTRGPGEKKLEVDRRHIRERIDELERSLEEVRKNRDIQRERRKTSSIPVISLVGYTNSGKSTLRNRLAHMYQADPNVKKEDVLEADMLFATLDPTTRLIKLPRGKEVLVSDTVGFIRKLPHDLVDAFRATLEEVVYSDLLIHVVDSSAPNAAEQIKAVNNVLKQLGVMDKPIIVALNKVDKTGHKDILSLFPGTHGTTIEISALHGDAVEDLLAMIEVELFSHIQKVVFKIPYDKMSIKSILYKECSILLEDYDENSVMLTAEVDEAVLNKYAMYLEKSE